MRRRRSGWSRDKRGEEETEGVMYGSMTMSTGPRDLPALAPCLVGVPFGCIGRAPLSPPTAWTPISSGCEAERREGGQGDGHGGQPNKAHRPPCHRHTHPTSKHAACVDLASVWAPHPRSECEVTLVLRAILCVLTRSEFRCGPLRAQSGKRRPLQYSSQVVRQSG